MCNCIGVHQINRCNDGEVFALNSVSAASLLIHDPKVTHSNTNADFMKCTKDNVTKFRLNENGNLTGTVF